MTHALLKGDDYFVHLEAGGVTSNSNTECTVQALIRAPERGLIVLSYFEDWTRTATPACFFGVSIFTADRLEKEFKALTPGRSNNKEKTVPIAAWHKSRNPDELFSINSAAVTPNGRILLTRIAERDVVKHSCGPVAMWDFLALTRILTQRKEHQVNSGDSRQMNEGKMRVVGTRKDAQIANAAWTGASSGMDEKTVRRRALAVSPCGSWFATLEDRSHIAIMSTVFEMRWKTIPLSPLMLSAVLPDITAVFFAAIPTRCLPPPEYSFYRADYFGSITSPTTTVLFIMGSFNEILMCEIPIGGMLQCETNAASGEKTNNGRLHRFKLHGGSTGVTSAAISPCCTMLAVAEATTRIGESPQHVLRVYLIQDGGKLVPRVRREMPSGATGAVQNMAFSDDGRRLLCQLDGLQEPFILEIDPTKSTLAMDKLNSRFRKPCLQLADNAFCCDGQFMIRSGRSELNTWSLVALKGHRGNNPLQTNSNNTSGNHHNQLPGVLPSSPTPLVAQQHAQRQPATRVAVMPQQHQQPVKGSNVTRQQQQDPSLRTPSSIPTRPPVPNARRQPDPPEYIPSMSDPPRVRMAGLRPKIAAKRAPSSPANGGIRQF